MAQSFHLPTRDSSVSGKPTQLAKHEQRRPRRFDLRLGKFIFVGASRISFGVNWRAGARRWTSLECGSGLLTIILVIMAQETGQEIWMLEHNEDWGNRVSHILEDLGITAVRLCVKPLRDYSDGRWYDPPIDDMRSDLELVICDGPKELSTPVVTECCRKSGKSMPNFVG